MTVARVAAAIATLCVLALVVLALGGAFVWWAVYMASPRAQQAVLAIVFVFAVVIVITVLSEVGKVARIQRKILAEWEAKHGASSDKSGKEKP